MRYTLDSTLYVKNIKVLEYVELGVSAHDWISERLLFILVCLDIDNARYRFVGRYLCVETKVCIDDIKWMGLTVNNICVMYIGWWIPLSLCNLNAIQHFTNQIVIGSV